MSSVLWINFWMLGEGLKGPFLAKGGKKNECTIQNDLFLQLVEMAHIKAKLTRVGFQNMFMLPVLWMGKQRHHNEAEFQL